MSMYDSSPVDYVKCDPCTESSLRLIQRSRPDHFNEWNKAHFNWFLYIYVRNRDKAMYDICNEIWIAYF